MFGIAWLDPTNIIDWLGPMALIGVCIIIFAETGFFAFLPGDSLLFITGMLTATGFNGASQPAIDFPLWFVCAVLFASAFLGDQLGFFIGKKAGPALFRKDDAKVFKKEHLEKAHAFFEKYGGRSVLLARFVPIVRTFVPITAGAAKMHYRTFVVYNIIGGFVWTVGLTVAGYFLGQVDWVAHYIEYVLIAIVALSLIPIIIEYMKARNADSTPEPADENALDEELEQVWQDESPETARETYTADEVDGLTRD